MADLILAANTTREPTAWSNNTYTLIAFWTRLSLTTYSMNIMILPVVDILQGLRGYGTVLKFHLLSQRSLIPQAGPILTEEHLYL